jgi:Rad3-related DNA helicase
MALASITAKIQEMPSLAYDYPMQEFEQPSRESVVSESGIKDLANSIDRIAEDVHQLVTADSPQAANTSLPSVAMGDSMEDLIDAVDTMRENLQSELEDNTDAIKDLLNVNTETKNEIKETAEESQDQKELDRQRKSAKEEKAESKGTVKRIGKTVGEKAKSGLAEIFGVFKKMIFGFIKTVPLILAGLFVAGSMILDPEEMTQIFVSIKDTLFKIAGSLKPIFDYIVTEIIPVLWDVTKVGFEMLSNLFANVILPGLTFALPYAKLAFQALGEGLIWLADALGNIPETTERMILRVKNNVANMLDTILDGIDTVKIVVADWLNSVIAKANRFGLGLDQVEFGEEARKNIQERSEQRKGREDEIANLDAKKAVRRATKANPNVNPKLVELETRRQYILENSKEGFNDSRIDEINREIFAIRNNSSTEKLYGSSTTTEVSSVNSTETLLAVPRPAGPMSVASPVVSERTLATNNMMTATEKFKETQSAAQASGPVIVDSSNKSNVVNNNSSALLNLPIETANYGDSYLYNGR